MISYMLNIQNMSRDVFSVLSYPLITTKTAWWSQGYLLGSLPILCAAYRPAFLPLPYDLVDRVQSEGYPGPG